MNRTSLDRNLEYAPYNIIVAEVRFRNSIQHLMQVLEEKQNFNPSQPRHPKGNPTGGQWRRDSGGVPSPGVMGFSLRAMQLSVQLQKIIDEHEGLRTRLEGGLQLVGAAGEGVATIATAITGLATIETPAGIPTLLLSAWMAANTYDNARTAWRDITTGEPHETTLHATLRGLSLTEAQATAAEIALSGVGALAAAKMGRRALDKAAKAGLDRLALEPFDPKLALDVKAGSRSLWAEPNIADRGTAWEIFDARRTGYRLLPRGHPTFDQLSRNGEIAVNNKTIDIMSPTYSAQIARLYLTK